MIDWGMKYNPDASYPKSMVEEAIRNKAGLIKKSRKLQVAHKDS